MKHFTEFKKFDVEKRIAYGVIYEPLKADSEGDWARAETIEKWAHEFAGSNKAANVDVQHNLKPCGSRIVESFIARKSDPDFPEGAWCVGVKNPPEIWKLIKSGEINGYSMYGRGQREARSLPNDPAAKHELIDGEIEILSLVAKAANKRTFTMTKSDNNIGDALTSIANAIQKMGQKLERIDKRVTGNDARLASLSTSTSGGVRKAEPAPQRDPEVHRLLRKRDRLNDRLASIWERPDRFEPDAEREVRKSLQRIDDDLHAHGHQDKQTGLDSNSAFYFRGGSSTFITGGGSSIEDILGVGHSTRNISKSDEDDIEVENCLIL